MNRQRKVYFTVTNDLSFDQRMIRICISLAGGQYEVTLVGRVLRDSVTLQKMPFSQKRLRCLFNKGVLFYAEYNIRLFIYLLFKKADIICAIDLDTIIPCYWISVIKKSARVYDAHELFCEMKELAVRPFIYWCWKRIEKGFVPGFKKGYTVNTPIAEEFSRMYGCQYAVIRNLPVLQPLSIPVKKERYILYQGAVNEGRSFETLIPAMRNVQARLIICGDGNFMQQAKQLVKENGLENKVIFEGKKTPEDLRHYTLHAWVGVTLFDDSGRSNYLSLSNRFFDYMHAGIPQLCVGYPVYREINAELPFALLTDNLDADSIANGLNSLLEDELLYGMLQKNCLQRRSELSWQMEEKKLLAFYNNL
jgi:glycosyltransferase involved in cell wall biosynthesis